MELHTEWMRPAGGGVPVYLARPARIERELPVILVIQEVWGVDTHIQDLAQRFATAGYLAAAPDIYAHGGTRPAALAPERVSVARAVLDAAPPAAWSDPAARDAAVNTLPEAQRAPTRETLSALLTPDRPIDRFMADLEAAAAAVAEHPASNGRVASVGYCLGGMLSALLAGRLPSLAGAAIYYGSSPKPEAMEALACPLIGFYGAEDVRITGGVPAFAESVRASGGQMEVHVYGGTPHAFFNDTRPSYRIDAARDAWARTLDFFRRVLAAANA